MTPPLFTGKRIKGARYCEGLGISFSRNPTHLHIVSLPSISRISCSPDCCFRSRSPTHFTYNQSCPELVVKISLTRLALLSRFVLPFPSPLLAQALTTFFLQPDSQKSTTEHVGDMFKGKTDSAASTVQPNVSGLFIFPFLQLTPIIP